MWFMTGCNIEVVVSSESQLSTASPAITLAKEHDNICSTFQVNSIPQAKDYTLGMEPGQI
jgi:hypothetical protein